NWRSKTTGISSQLRPTFLARRPIALPHRVQPHEVRGARSELCSGHQAEHVPGAEKTFWQQFLLGGPDHRLRRLPLVFVNRMYAPKRIHAIADFQLTTESIDTNLGTMFRKRARRVAAFGEDGDRAHGQIFGGVRDGLADGFGG